MTSLSPLWSILTKLCIKVIGAVNSTISGKSKTMLQLDLAACYELLDDRPTATPEGFSIAEYAGS